MADVPPMAGKSVLVTGGTTGIGKVTDTGLAAPGRPTVDAFAADMSVQAGIRRLAAQVHDTYPRLDVLVNNAGCS